MLFIASRRLGHNVDEQGRLLLLERLQEKGLTPLIRSTRFGCYKQALSGLDNEGEMERTIAALTEHEDKTSYIKGDVFFFDDHALYLIFEETGYEPAGMRAGVVYESYTTEPLRKLDDFCREVSDFLVDQGSAATGLSMTDGGRHLAPEWRDGRPQEQQGFTRFVAHQDIDSLNTVIRRETAVERARAAALLEDDAARLFLHRATEAYVEGCAAKLLANRTGETAGRVSIEKLMDAGLLRREVLVSCRKMGHILFSLPSPDALAVVTVSNATCSGCGAAIADEKVEEAVAPTPLASALLEDGSWLVNRLYFTLRELGLPGSEVAIAPPSGNGEAHMMANVCGESFLLVLRDGDLSPAFARRATDAAIKTEATHLMIVVTGKIYEEGQLWLRNYARRRARSGVEFELKIAEGVSAAESSLQESFEQVSRRALAEQLCELDTSLGLSLTRVITTRFQLLQRSRGANGFARLAIAAPVSNLRPVEPANHFTRFASDTQLTGSASK
ncbi:MAG: hypothetical protein WCF57_06495 [Pyrinomonadaceae bacterium]